jgi:hypothetical protein
MSRIEMSSTATRTDGALIARVLSPEISLQMYRTLILICSLDHAVSNPNCLRMPRSRS